MLYFIGIIICAIIAIKISKPKDVDLLDDTKTYYFDFDTMYTSYD